MGNYNLSIRNHENQEILYLRGNEDLVKLNTLINEQSHVVNSESLTPETAASAPFSTPSPSTATKTKPFLLNNDLIPLIREIRQQVKESIRSRKVHDILTPFDLPYFRVSELTRDEVKYVCFPREFPFLVWNLYSRWRYEESVICYDLFAIV